MKKALILLVVVLFLVAGSYVFYHYYDFLFASEIKGVVVNVDRVTQPQAIITGGGNGAIPPAQLYSFAVAIRDEKGEIHTASSEDRQWAVVQSGQCAEAKFFPYPPWQLDRAGTYHGARLLRLFECGNKSATPAPAVTPTPSSSTPAPTPSVNAPTRRRVPKK